MIQNMTDIGVLVINVMAIGLNPEHTAILRFIRSKEKK
jgi:hypothetical protein